MYAEVKTGHLYPTVLKIRLQWAPLHTATWKQGSTSHLLPCSQRRRRWFPQGSTAPRKAQLLPPPPSCLTGLVFNATTPSGASTNAPSSWLAASSPSKAQLSGSADREREAAIITMARPAAGKSRGAESILRSKRSAIRKAKQQHPVRGIARPCSSLLPFLLQKDEHSSLRTVLLSSFCLWPHEALLIRAPIESHCKNRDQHEPWSRGACFHITLSVRLFVTTFAFSKNEATFLTGKSWKQVQGLWCLVPAPDDT